MVNLYIIQVILVVDAFVLGVWLSPYYFSLLGVAAIGAVLWRKKKAGPQVTGWRVGDAVDLTDPESPVKVDGALIPTKTINLGILAIGGPGSGKTESIALAFFAELPKACPGSGLAFFEGKGDIDIYKKAVASGRAPDKFFSSELPGSDSINLMDGSPDDVVDRMTRLLIGHTSSTSFYSDAQRAVLTCTIPVLLALEEPVCIRDLYVTLSSEDAATEVLIKAKAVEGIDPTLLGLYEQWLEQDFASRTAEIKGLLNKLFVFCNGRLTDRINAYAPDIRVKDVVLNNEFIYFHLPLSEFSRDVAIAIVEMFGVEARRRQLAGPEQYAMFPLLMDDWGGFFHSNFGPFSARCRSAGMPLIFSFQSLAQVRAVSQEFADELDDNLATKIVLRVNGESTARFAVNLLGTYESVSVGINNGAAGRGDATNIGYVEKPRVSAKDFRELIPGECYISTVLPHMGGINPLWRTRIPRAPYTDESLAEVTMPEAKQVTGEGLNLWGKYMTPTTAAALDKLLAEDVESAVVMGEGGLSDADDTQELVTDKARAPSPHVTYDDDDDEEIIEL